MNVRAQFTHPKCRIVLRAFGDSHADIVQIEALKNVPLKFMDNFKSFSYSAHGKLMYSIGRDGIELDGLLRNPKQVSIRPWTPFERRRVLFNLLIPGFVIGKRTNAPPITEKDVFYFVFGEIDARHKLADMMFREKRTNIFEEINNLVDKYMNAVKKAVSKYPIKTVLIGGLHPQSIETENTNGWSPITGSYERRSVHTLLINRKLKNISKKLGYHFIDFTEGYSLPDGSLNMTLSDGNHHLIIWPEDTKYELAELVIAHL